MAHVHENEDNHDASYDYGVEGNEELLVLAD